MLKRRFNLINYNMIYLSIVSIVGGVRKFKDGIDLVSPVKVEEVDVKTFLFGKSVSHFPGNLSLVIINIFIPTNIHEALCRR